jgi:hypothetical protein
MDNDAEVEFLTLTSHYAYLANFDRHRLAFAFSFRPKVFKAIL